MGAHRAAVVTLAAFVSSWPTFSGALGAGVATVAGGGPVDAPAASAGFLSPSGVAVDGAGRVYFTAVRNRVYRLNAGLVELVAGNGTSSGYAGDGGKAVKAEFSAPVALAFDSFGATDLVFRDMTGATTQIWTMNGAVRAATSTLVGLPAGWPIVGSDDFDRAGKSQLLLADPSRRLFVQAISLGQPSGSPRPITGTPALPASWVVAATADFNGDTSPDVLLRDESTQDISIWLLNGTSYASTLTPSPHQAQDATWEVVGANDLNGDKIPDLLWYNRVSGRLVYWLLDRQAQRTAGDFTNPMSAGNANWRPVATGDYGTGPGGMPDTRDIVWRNDASGRLVLWYMDRAASRTAGVFVSPDPSVSVEVVAPR